MPLLGKECFQRKTLPENISDEEEVYFCKTTYEAFQTFDQFFERQILCSSMVWTCAITGKTGLTFEEALESERNANDMLTAFPTALQTPVLYLMNYINESKFGSVVDMIYAFISNRYFIGEEIEFIISGKKRIKGKVVQVIPPTYSQIINNVNNNKKCSSQTLCFGEDPILYKYQIIHSKDIMDVIGSERITRTKGILTKDKVRLFLKQHLTASKRFQPLIVSQSSKEEFNIQTTKWLDIFSGLEPNFHDQTVIVKTFNKDKQKAIRDAKHNISDRSDSSQSSASKRSSFQSKASTSTSGSGNKYTIIKNDKKSTDVPKIVSPEEKQRQREEVKLQKLEQKKLEKELKKQFEEDMKEWNAKRDDLACDDLLPLPNPIPIKSLIPTQLFGDTLVIIEFLHCFNNLFNLKGIFPSGITFELMQQILYDNDIHGPFGDLLKIIFTSILTLQEEEEAIDINLDRDESSEDEAHNEEEPTDRIPVNSSDKNPNHYLFWIQQHLGQNLSQLCINPFTITEVLRLHLLSSGAGPKPRSKYRGLYHSREDPGIQFVSENKALMSKLESDTIYELLPEERVKIFQVLIHQILSFVTFREHVDNAFEEISKLNRNIRDIQTVFNKWNRENSLQKRFPTKTDSNVDNEKNETNETQAQSSGPTLKQLEEYKREKSLKEEEMLKSCSDIRTQIRRMRACYGLKPIGFDRSFRRYWIFESLPGLFVEHLVPDTKYTDLPFGPCLEEQTPIKSCKPNSFEEIQLQNNTSNKGNGSQQTLRDDSSTTSDKENEITISHSKSDLIKTSNCGKLSHFDRCSANIETCSVHGFKNSDQRVKWAFYYTFEHLNDLISSLNSRGNRESELQMYLKQNKSVINELLSRCQPNKLNEDIPVPEVRKSQRLQEILHLKGDKTLYSDFTSKIALLKALKDYLIDIEERIFAGSLGQVNDVSRDEWKELINKTSETVKKQEMINNFTYGILILAQNIRPLCLSLPLNGENGALDHWSESLKQCSSLSQLFVHLSILDHSIKWSKSALKAYCKICRRKCDAENMLLCDKCNRGHHTYCLQPSLDSIPRGEWLCPDCIPKFIPQSPNKQKNKSIESDDNNSDNNSFDSEDSEYEKETDDQNELFSELSSTNSREYSESTSDDSIPSKEYDICGICNKIDPNLQLMCTKCRNFYHLECANVLRITRSEWTCSLCSSNAFQNKKRKHIDINIDESDDEIETKRTKRSGRYSQDFDYLDGEKIYEEVEEEKVKPNSSSRRRFDKSKTTLRKSLPLDFSLCEHILKQLQRHKDGYIFMNRPNYAPNYNRIIKKYVDFGSLVSNLNQGKYTTNLHFFRDILLMLNNAAFYNHKNSDEYKSCKGLAQHFEQLLKEFDVDLTHDLIFPHFY